MSEPLSKIKHDYLKIKCDYPIIEYRPDGKVKLIKYMVDGKLHRVDGPAYIEYYENGIYPWIKTGELKDSIILESEEYITESAIQNSSAKLFEKDSLIIAMYGATLGQIGINKMQATCNQACCVLRPKDNVPCGIYYLYMFFLFNRNYLISLGSGAAQQNLSQVVINKLNFLLPKN